MCSPRCRASLKQNSEALEKLRDLCERAHGATSFLLLQAKALNLLTDYAGIRLSDDLMERFWTGDLQLQEVSALAAAVIHTGNGSQHEQHE
jgi:hypothetical protein